MDLQALLASAGSAHANGRLADCAGLCEQVLAKDPGNVQAKLLLGVVLAKSGDPTQAISRLQEVERLDASSFQAPLWLSMTCRKVGLLRQAGEAAARAVSLKPHDPQANAQLALCYMDERQLPQAESCLRNAIRVAPDVVQIQCYLSRCLQLQGRHSEAISVIRTALGRTQPSLDALLKIGQLLLTQENGLGAREFGRKAVQLFPASSAAHLLLSRALMEDHRAAEAADHLHEVIKLEPANHEAVTMLGSALQSLGRLEEASQRFRESIEKEPDQGFAYFALLHNQKVTENDRAVIERVKALLESGALPKKQLSYLHYGLAKAYDDLGEYESALREYDAANQIEHDLKFKGQKFDEAGYAAAFSWTEQKFTRNFVASRETIGSKSELPVFVVGMMRSGTTLVEQILSSHPEVGAAGEQPFWLDNWRSAMDHERTDIEARELRSLCDRYLSLLKEISPDKARVVDKMPGNYPGLGILHLAFPKARIIHTRRHPVDTCLSIYATPNRTGTEFAHDRKSIVFGYQQYLRIMRHFREVLPADCFLEVDYEDLIQDSEATTRRMIEFCGLDWNDLCLRPEDNARAVVTPSVWQVRQPIYRSSMERWRKFEPWLGPFGELLGVNT